MKKLPSEVKLLRALVVQLGTELRFATRDYPECKVGDLVIETTTGRRRAADPDIIGEVVTKGSKTGDDAWVIRNLRGKLVKWGNCSFAVLPRPRSWPESLKLDDEKTEGE